MRAAVIMQKHTRGMIDRNLFSNQKEHSVFTIVMDTHIVGDNKISTQKTFQIDQGKKNSKDEKTNTGIDVLSLELSSSNDEMAYHIEDLNGGVQNNSLH